MFKYRCKVCGYTDKQYKDELSNEVQHFDYLRKTWEKCQRFNQITTGIRQLDNVITVLFGKPHENDWRDYAKYSVRVRDTSILRMVYDED